MNKKAKGHQASQPHRPAETHAPDQHQPGPSSDTAEHLTRQLADLTAALQRERADAMNTERRHQAQMAGLRSAATASVVRELLPVIDNFERALKHVPANLAGNDYVKGIQGIVRQFEKVLSDLGVAKIKTVGEPFDPYLHEAVSMEEGDGDQEVVSEELQAGYTLGDNVLRHATVRVKTQ